MRAVSLREGAQWLPFSFTTFSSSACDFSGVFLAERARVRPGSLYTAYIYIQQADTLSCQRFTSFLKLGCLASAAGRGPCFFGWRCGSRLSSLDQIFPYFGPALILLSPVFLTFLFSTYYDGRSSSPLPPSSPPAPSSSSPV